MMIQGPSNIRALRAALDRELAKQRISHAEAVREQLSLANEDPEDLPPMNADERRGMAMLRRRWAGETMTKIAADYGMTPDKALRRIRKFQNLPFTHLQTVLNNLPIWIHNPEDGRYRISSTLWEQYRKPMVLLDSGTLAETGPVRHIFARVFVWLDRMEYQDPKRSWMNVRKALEEELKNRERKDIVSWIEGKFRPGLWNRADWYLARNNLVAEWFVQGSPSLKLARGRFVTAEAAAKAQLTLLNLSSGDTRLLPVRKIDQLYRVDCISHIENRFVLGNHPHADWKIIANGNGTYRVATSPTYKLPSAGSAFASVAEAVEAQVPITNAHYKEYIESYRKLMNGVHQLAAYYPVGLQGIDQLAGVI